MASHKTSIVKTLRRSESRAIPPRGFTLIETLVVVSIFTMLASATLFFDIGNFRGTSFNAEAGNLVSALQTARADALNNVHQAKHGVAINPGTLSGFVIFEGDDYAHRDTTRDNLVPSMYRVERDPASPSEVVFTQLSGNANYNGVVKILDQNRGASTTIAINNEGRISW